MLLVENAGNAVQRWEAKEIDQDGVQVPASVAEINLFGHLQTAHKAESGTESCHMNDGSLVALD